MELYKVCTDISCTQLMSVFHFFMSGTNDLKIDIRKMQSRCDVIVSRPAEEMTREVWNYDTHIVNIDQYATLQPCFVVDYGM